MNIIYLINLMDKEPKNTEYREDDCSEHFLDAVGLYCPAPIAMLKAYLEEIKEGQTVKILADDPKFPEDLLSWCKRSGNELVRTGKHKNDVFYAYVKKR
jgi:TusA-related sulfurtransferase